MKTILLLTAAVIAAIPLTTVPAAAQDKPVIALSNSFYGNTWRRQMVDAFTAQAEKAKAEGQIADYVVLNGDGSVAQQNSQLAELILRGVDAIAINAASDTALNDIVTRPATPASRSSPSTAALRRLRLEARLRLHRLQDRPGRGDARPHRRQGQRPRRPRRLGLAPRRRDVRRPEGGPRRATRTSRSSPRSSARPPPRSPSRPSPTSCPRCPPIDAVLGQGGSDDFGIARAFEQYGGPYAEKMPVIEGGGSIRLRHLVERADQASSPATRPPR